MALEVYLPQGRPEFLGLLRAAVEPRVRLHVGKRPDPPSYEVLVAGRPEAGDVSTASGLRAVVIPWAGVPSETLKLMRDFPGITLHNLHHNAAPTAELAVALLLAAAKCIVPLDGALRKHDWRPRYEKSRSVLLCGKTVLVLGYGAIGKRVAAVCRALGMQVAGVRRRGAEPGTPDEVHAPTALHELLPRAHAVVVCLPLTAETEGMLGARELALLPEGALLVNVGRAAIVDEDALYDALASGRLGAAGLDVWYEYPANEEARAQTPPSRRPFGELDNVVLSPHRGGLCKQTEALRAAALAELLLAAAQGRALPGAVDLEAGY